MITNVQKNQSIVIDDIKKGLTKNICSSDLGEIVCIMDLFGKNNWGTMPVSSKAKVWNSS